MLRIFLLSLVFLSPVGLAAQTGDPVTNFSGGDVQMNAAQDEARQTLPLFMDNVLNEEGFGLETASVKVAFPTGDGAEIIWISPFLVRGADDIVGVLANQPNFITGYNQGDPIGFTMEMIRDWSLVSDDGNMYGHYTTRVMLPELDPATQNQLAGMLSKNPVPADW